jgi:hypothetical protein
MIDEVEVTPFTVVVRVFPIEEIILEIYPQVLPVPTMFPLTSVARHCEDVEARELNLKLLPINVPLAILKFKLESSESNLSASAIAEALIPFTLSAFNAKGADVNCTLGDASASVPIFTPR